MKCPFGAEFADLVIQRLTRIQPDDHRSRILGVAGYPFTGKSRLAQEIGDLWLNDMVTILPTESAIFPRSHRLDEDVDGCSREAHDIPLLQKYATALSTGQSIQCYQYSWTSGDFGQMVSLEAPGTDGLLIIDGTVAADPEILQLCDCTLYISPESEWIWLPLACHRDISSRSWDVSLAASHNRRKAFTAASMKPRSQLLSCINVLIDPVSWTWFFPGCNTCNRITQPLDILVQPPISIFDCKAR